MTARLEYLLGLGSLVVAGLVMTALYLRAELRRREQGDDSALERVAPT